MLWQWRPNKPLRYGDARDAEVQQFLAKGVEIMDALKTKMMHIQFERRAAPGAQPLRWNCRSRWKRC